jgi:GNAT superfamily N-acetyltransferase
MPTLRRATEADAALITAHRHSMFTDNQFAAEERLDAMDANFLPWVRERLVDGRYVGLLLEEDGVALASAGIHFNDFPPHFLHPEQGRAYLLNFYTAAEARGRGFAKQLLAACIAECRDRGSKVVVLHASRFGRPIYEKFGFTQTNEMMLKLD